MKRDSTEQVHLRLPKEVVRHAEQIARKLTIESGVETARAGVIRAAIERGLAVLDKPNP